MDKVSFHHCHKWWRAGLKCPFSGPRHQTDDDADDDDDALPDPKNVAVGRKRSTLENRTGLRQFDAEFWRNELRAIAPELDYEIDPLRPAASRRSSQQVWPDLGTALIPTLLALMLGRGLGHLLGRGISSTGKAGQIAETQLSRALQTSSGTNRPGGSGRPASGSLARGGGGFADNYWRRLGILPPIGNRRLRNEMNVFGFSDPFGGLV